MSNVKTQTTVSEIKGFIVEQVKKGNIGVATMGLYDNGDSVRDINKAVRELLDEGTIKINTYRTGYPLYKSDEYGVKQALTTRSFSIELVK